MIVKSDVYQCDHEACKTISLSKFKICSSCFGEFCPGHISSELIICSRHMHGNMPRFMTGFGLMCDACQGKVRQLKPSVLRRLFMEAAKDPNNLREKEESAA